MSSDVLPVWWDPAADGPANMAADELLAEEAVRRDGLVIRVYAWSEPTVSLGAFQPFAEAEACAAIAGLPIVRRPSGGGAIIHGTDLTYAAAMPKGHPWGGTPQALYDGMHAAMVDVLRDHGFDARLHAPSADDPPADALLCFSRRSPGDVVVRQGDAPAAKVMGSAQRRLGTAVLQHGSLLLAACPRVADAARHVGLAELARGRVDWTARSLAERWIAGIAVAGGLTTAEQPAAFAANLGERAAVRDAHFRDPRWTGRR